MIGKVLITVASLLVGSQAMAYGDAGCGLGSLIWTKNSFLSQMLAVSTNGLSANQTFGITSGTSGCKRKGFVRREMEQKVFVAANMNTLKEEFAQGRGEATAALSYLVGCQAAAESFGATMQQNYSAVVGWSEPSSEEFLHNVKAAILSNPQLASACGV